MLRRDWRLNFSSKQQDRMICRFISEERSQSSRCCMRYRNSDRFYKVIDRVDTVEELLQPSNKDQYSWLCNGK